MNKHLKAVRELHEILRIQQVNTGELKKLPDMEIIRYQALLMDAGCETFLAVKAGEMAEILAGLTNLAYVAISAIARLGGEVIDIPIYWQQDGFVLSVITVVSDKINQCNSGHADKYSAVYCLCVHLVRSFVNADFDKAFQMIHTNNISRATKSGESILSDCDKHHKLKLQPVPDLCECLYE